MLDWSRPECCRGVISRLELLRQQVGGARDDPEALRVIYRDLVDALGADEASRLWWAVFAERDAPVTG